MEKSEFEVKSLYIYIWSRSLFERNDSAQFSRNSDSRDVSRITVSTLPLTTKYPKLPEHLNHQVFWLEKFTQKTLPKTNPGQRG